MTSNEELKAMEIEIDNNIIICEKCYEENEATRTICKICGAKLYKNNVIENNKNEEEKNYNYKDNYQTNTSNTDNKIAKALRIVAIIEIICSFIVGCILGNTFGVYEYNWGLCIGILVAGIINGVFILGFAEIIQKLQNIEDNTKK